MDYYPVYYLIIILSASSVAVLFLLRKISGEKRRRRLPPGPAGWPFFGNMFQLGPMPQRTIAKLRDQYGPVVWLKIGAINSMAILSTKAASDFFKNHDVAFADRTITDMMRVHNYHKSSVALAPYGSYWRLMRRLVTVDMLTAKRLNDTASIRRKCVDDMVFWIAKEAQKLEQQGRGVHVARFVFLMSFNLLGNLMLSRDLFDPDSKDGSEFFTAMRGLLEWTGHPNVVDVFPWLRRFDPQGLRRLMDRDMGIALKMASKYVKQRMDEGQHNKHRDFLDVLLDHQDNDDISDEHINIFILVSQLIN